MVKIKKGRQTIAKNAEVAASSISKVLGLMFRKKAAPILFEFEEDKRWAIHSLFVFFSFDAVFLDANYVVVDVFQSVKPFTLYIRPRRKCRFLLEMPAGFARKFKIKCGEKISVV
ncbi:MAG: DUF192 domain-containing protein [Candidatus Anstonellales archaeon]